MRRLVVAAGLVASGSAAMAGERALDALVASYPGVVAGYDAKDLILKSGQRIPLSDGRRDKTPEDRVNAADINDMFVSTYPAGPIFKAPASAADDPGRARNKALFDAMYGDCRRGKLPLKTIPWMPGAGGGSVQVTTVNGIADRLEAVSRDLDALGPKFRAYLAPSAGTFNCRPVAGTTRMSMHAYGAAIDINVRFTDYWRWGGAKKETDPVVYKNRIPLEIVSVFEKHGFIWGGKWYHYDTMHFEYRPDILALSK